MAYSANPCIKSIELPIQACGQSECPEWGAGIGVPKHKRRWSHKMSAATPARNRAGYQKGKIIFLL